MSSIINDFYLIFHIFKNFFSLACIYAFQEQLTFMQGKQMFITDKTIFQKFSNRLEKKKKRILFLKKVFIIIFECM